MKKFIVMIMAILMTLTVVSCGKNEDSKDATKGTDKDVQKQAESGNKSDSTPVAKINEPFTVKTEQGDYKLTFEKARKVDARNSMSEKEVKQVVCLDYTYENVSFTVKDRAGMNIDETAFQIIDDEGNVVDTYPYYDENRPVKDTPVGAKCKASATYGITTDSKNIKVTFLRGDNDSDKVCTITLPIE